MRPLSKPNILRDRFLPCFLVVRRSRLWRRQTRSVETYPFLFILLLFSYRLFLILSCILFFHSFIYFALVFIFFSPCIRSFIESKKKVVVFSLFFSRLSLIKPKQLFEFASWHVVGSLDVPPNYILFLTLFGAIALWNNKTSDTYEWLVASHIVSEHRTSVIKSAILIFFLSFPLLPHPHPFNSHIQLSQWLVTLFPVSFPFHVSARLAGIYPTLNNDLTATQYYPYICSVGRLFFSAHSSDPIKDITLTSEFLIKIFSEPDQLFFWTCSEYVYSCHFISLFYLLGAKLFKTRCAQCHTVEAVSWHIRCTHSGDTSVIQKAELWVAKRLWDQLKD
jgi:hypothetical protein